MLCKVLKSTDAAKPMVWQSVGDSIPSEEDATAGARATLNETNELKRRIAELERNRDAELAQTRQQGFQEGLKQGLEQASLDVKASSDRLARTLNDLSMLKRKVRSEAELQVVQLAIAVARRILYRELVTDPEAIEGLVHAALQKLNNREISRVRVYPAAADVIRSCMRQIGAPQATEVVADPSLKNGDVIFETSVGELDASVDTQLQEIQRGFADRCSIR